MSDAKPPLAGAAGSANRRRRARLVDCRCGFKWRSRWFVSKWECCPQCGRNAYRIAVEWVPTNAPASATGAEQEGDPYED